MKILFLHGWQSAPGGRKPTYLRDHGCEVINPKLDDDDFDLALRTAQAEFDRHTPDVIVGSSRGGAVAMNVQAGDTPQVLLCPAWKNWGGARTVKPGTVILHSREDEVIPYEHSVELAEASGATLIEVGKDHRLADTESLEVMIWACKVAASGQQLPSSDDDPGSAFKPIRKGASAPQEEASYVCDACGEEIVVPLDLTEGSSQTYIEDCPVCCRANIIHVEVDDDGNTSVHAQPEQDYD
jgi:predicted esterase YcpF (UPF0227 family)